MNLKRDRDTMQTYQEIMRSNQSELDKVAAAFKLVTDFYITHGENEIELRRAMKDQETMVKEQIKVSTIKHLRTVFADAYQAATGRKVWHG